MSRHVPRAELFQAQMVVLLAIALQVVVWAASHELFLGPQVLIISSEIALVVLISLINTFHTRVERFINHVLATILLGLLSVANFTSLVLVIERLIFTQENIRGPSLLAAALAIFLTNIIVFSLWYWEIDSPGLTLRKWSKHDKDFQFTQQDLPKDFPDWKPQFVDYAYLSVTNAINFAPADTKPVTHQAKIMMSTQALISVFTLALVLARSVSILN